MGIIRLINAQIGFSKQYLKTQLLKNSFYYIVVKS